MVKTNIVFPDTFLKELDEHIKKIKTHNNRSHFIIDACKEKIIQDKKRTA